MLSGYNYVLCKCDLVSYLQDTSKIQVFHRWVYFQKKKIQEKDLKFKNKKLSA